MTKATEFFDGYAKEVAWRQFNPAESFRVEDIYDDTWREVQMDFQSPGENFTEHHPDWQVVQKPKLDYCAKYAVRYETVLRHVPSGVLYIVASYDSPYGMENYDNERGELEAEGDDWFIECEPTGTEVIYKPLSKVNAN
jgi:hypothetical protein